MRVDRLKGRRVTVGTHALSVKKKIGEGGSAFVYVARRSNGSQSSSAGAFSFSSTPPTDQEQQPQKLTSHEKERHDKATPPLSSRPPLISPTSICSPPASPLRKDLCTGEQGDPYHEQDVRLVKSETATMLASKPWSQMPRKIVRGNGTIDSGDSSNSNVNSRKKERKRKISKKKKRQQKGLVVLKASAVGGSTERRIRAMHEAEILRVLCSHPNVVTFLDSCFVSSASVSSSSSSSSLSPLSPLSIFSRKGSSSLPNKADFSSVANADDGVELFQNNAGAIEATLKDDAEEEIHFLLMEHCPGGSLMDLIVKRRKIALVRSKKKNNRRHTEAAYSTSSGSLGEKDQASLDENDNSVNGNSTTSSSSTLKRKLYAIRKLGLDQSNHGWEPPRKRNSKSTSSQNRRHMGKRWRRGGRNSNKGGWDAVVSRPMGRLGTDIETKGSSLQPGYLRRDDVLDIFSQVVDAVSFMHNRGDLPPAHHGKHRREGSDGSRGITGGEKNCHHCRYHRIPSITHRDLKPENILLDFNYEDDNTTETKKRSSRHRRRWNAKLCDFGSAIIGNVPVTTTEERIEADRAIRSSTTQMYRSPEMIDLHMVEELTNKTDIWALGCTLYMMCFLQNCFDEDSSLASLSGRYLIPPGHSFGSDMEELIRRMLIIDPKDRATIDEVSTCVDAMRKGKALPPRPTPCRCVGIEVEEDTSFVKEDVAYLTTIDGDFSKEYQRNANIQNSETVAERRRRRVLVDNSSMVSQKCAQSEDTSQFWLDTSSLPSLGYCDSQSIFDDENTCYTGLSSVFSERWAEQSTCSVSSGWTYDGLLPTPSSSLAVDGVQSSEEKYASKFNLRMHQRSLSLPEEHAITTTPLLNQSSTSSSDLPETETMKPSKDWVCFDGSETFIEVTRSMDVNFRDIISENQRTVQGEEEEIPGLVVSPASSNQGSVAAVTPSTSGDNSPAYGREIIHGSTSGLSLSWDKFSTMRDLMPHLGEKDTYSLLDDDAVDSENPDRTRRNFPAIFSF